VNVKLVEDIANAVLYEGYMLYPYRPSSVKNRQRWNFGVVYPKAYSELQNGTDASFMQTECLAMARPPARLTIKVRFLQAVARTIGELRSPLSEWRQGAQKGPEPEFTIVGTLEVGDQILQTWQEVIEREIVVPSFPVTGKGSSHQSSVFAFPDGREMEPVHDRAGRIAGVIVRTRKPIEVKVEVAAECLLDGLIKISTRLLNVTVAGNADSESREEALMYSLLSAHTILAITGGEFVSHIDPPAPLKEAASGCNNVGTWPVLAGDAGERDCMLSSPIILYDYPQIAPESPGDLFDGTEIDEILALRILTLTEGEKDEMRRSDERSRQILERTETMPAEHFMKLHGVLRGLRPADEEKT
jgi:hypothetical protein